MGWPGRQLAHAVLLAIVFGGCGGGSPPADSADVGGTDGGPGREGGGPTEDAGGNPDAGFQLPFVVAPPDIPWLDQGEPPIAPPVLTPCPADWSETELAGVTVCEPWPPGGSVDCPPGQARLIG